MIKDFSQNFVMYHACGAWYHDGTNKIVNKNKRWIRPTLKPFSKKANDVRNKVETRTEVKLKSTVKIITLKDILISLMHFIKIKDILVQNMNLPMINLQARNQSKLIFTNKTLSNLILDKNSSLMKILLQTILYNQRQYPTLGMQAIIMKKRINSYPLPIRWKI